MSGDNGSSLDGERSKFWSGVAVGAATALLVYGIFDSLGVGIGNGSKLPAQDAIDLISERYWKPTTPEELESASIEGVIERLKKRTKDPFSHYFTAEEFDRFQASSHGEFTGIGLAVVEVRRGLEVSLVYENTPAKRAGIERGEIITEVNGKSIAGVSSDVATADIKGEPGTTVEIEVFNPRTSRHRTLEIERAAVRIPAVTGKLIKRDGKSIAYVRLASFSQGANEEVRDQVEALRRRGASGLVFDLRGNPGGLLEEGVSVSDIFVDDGLIVSTRERDAEPERFSAAGDALAEQPTVVLIDSGTASAAEIVSAAMSDHEVATLIGEQSFGKGTVQQVIPLDGGGAIDITIGEYFTSDGISLAGNGIKPDIHAPDKLATDRDETLERGLRELFARL